MKKSFTLIELVIAIVFISKRMIAFNVPLAPTAFLYRNLNLDNFTVGSVFGNGYTNGGYPAAIDGVVYMKKNIELLKNRTKEWLHTQDVAFCPEINYSDDDWEQLIKNSLHLTHENTSFYKFYVLYSTSLFYNQMMNNIGIWNWLI